MSKVKIQGNASGTGVVTLTAPNTNTDRTITLPDGDISLGVGIDDNATSTAITIDASEQVGIGTASPAGLLHISGSTTTTLPSIVIERTGSGSSKWDIKPYADTLTFRADATTTRLTLTNDGRGLSQFTAKAWVRFNGTGTVAINDSHNISSIVDNAVGHYTVIFSNNLGNTDFSVTSGVNSINTWGTTATVRGFATSGFQTYTADNAGTLRDVDFISFNVFGD